MSELLKDWVEGRSDSTYVSRFDKNPSNWEMEVESKNGFSSMIIELPKKINEKELIRKAYHMARMRMISLGLNRTSISLTNEDNCTNGESIRVATNVFDNTLLTPGQRMDNFLGEVVHEAAHILYTDFTEGTHIHKNPVKKALWNIIEDEYIEREIGKEFPGYSNYIAAIKAEIFGKNIVAKFSPEPGATKKSQNISEINEIINTVLLFVRYPKGLDMELVEKHEELLHGVKALFIGSYPKSTKECVDLAEALYDLIEDYYEKPPESSDPGSGENEEGEGEEGEEGSQGGESSGKGAEGKENSIPDPLKSGMPGAKELEELIANEQAHERNLEEDGKQYAEGLVEIMSSGADPHIEKNVNTSSNVSIQVLYDLEGTIDLADNKTVFIPMKVGDSSKYRSIKQDLLPYISPLAKFLKLDTYAKTRKLQGLRNGKLDEAKLVQGRLGDDKVHFKKHTQKVKGGVFGLLIDESGSMTGSTSSGHSSKISIARKLAIMFNEALTSARLNAFIYGHTADYVEGEGIPELSGSRETYITAYKEQNKAINQYALSNVEARSMNRDGVAIYETVKRIRKQTKDHIYLIVISDGSPNAGGYGGRSGKDDTRAQILRAQKKFDATIIGIAIEADYGVKELYPDGVDFDSMENFIPEMGRLIRSIVKKNYK